MEEDRTSESAAVLPEVSEPLTSETEKESVLTAEHEAHAVAVIANASSVSGVTGVEESFSLLTNPVRSSSPRQRRNREVSDGEAPSYKHENDNSVGANKNNESDNEVVPDKEEVCAQLLSTDELVVQQPQQQDAATQCENSQNDIFKELDALSNKMVDLALEIRASVDEAKELRRQRRREQALAAQPAAVNVIETVVRRQPGIPITKRKDTKKNAPREQRDSDVDC